MKILKEGVIVAERGAIYVKDFIVSGGTPDELQWVIARRLVLHGNIFTNKTHLSDLYDVGDGKDRHE